MNQRDAFDSGLAGLRTFTDLGWWAEAFACFLVCCFGAWILGGVPAFIGLLVMIKVFGTNPDGSALLLVSGATLIGAAITFCLFHATNR